MTVRYIDCSTRMRDGIVARNPELGPRSRPGGPNLVQGLRRSAWWRVVENQVECLTRPDALWIAGLADRIRTCDPLTPRWPVA